MGYHSETSEEFREDVAYLRRNKMLLLHSALLSCLAFLIKASHPDEVIDLPGLEFPLNYKHYSGYLNATSGRHLHYWFVESQRLPSKDPLLLWLNGGPGCSSLDGFLSELGPLHVSADGKTLYNNTYAWNRVANVLFLEAPAGVGFSYADDKKYFTDDDTVANDNYVALQHFFEKFPEFKRNDFYITGESYGGIYIPTLSVKVLTGPAKINFKGFAIGNGYLDGTNLTNSIVFFAYYHGLIGPELWSSLAQYCCGGHASQETCDFAGHISEDCQDAVSEVSHVVENIGLNVYNLYADCAYSKDKSSRYSVDKRNILRHLPKPKKGYMFTDDPPCTDSSNLRKWLNQPSVREALHIPTQVQDWDICSLDVEIGYKRVYNTMRPQMLKLIGSGKLRGLIYNGDVDMACNFLGDEWFSYNLGLKVTKDFRPWKFNDQVAGFVKNYGKLTFMTIKGSGHMVINKEKWRSICICNSLLPEFKCM
ncbi:lysosomal protective protein [Trichonephila inaurata madagascariensis]|uniref:Carboxypeptidase n=1 Tax=Trichonephila inaurata madagascariensis TaxID=2747483 RepID=A0A8X6XE01_9ARAC|nr:lysosomal protective protein [Trichonephila inaurata madagascariensis]